MTRMLRITVSLVLSGALLIPFGNAAHAQHAHHGHRKECNPTAEQRREAAEFARRTKAAVEKYENIAVAYQDNFYAWFDTFYKPIHHVINYEYYYDWRTLDPERPESLVYAHTHAGPQLIGVMYWLEGDRNPPPMGGCITRWHTHPMCKSPIGYRHIWEEDWGDCPPGWENDGESEWMLHVWTVPMEDGPYAYEPDRRWNCFPRPSPC